MVPLITLLVYVFAAFGLSIVVGFAKITFPIRNGLVVISKRYRALRPLFWVATLLECPMCLGFWTGVVAAIRFNVSLVGLDLITSAIVAGLFTSGSNFILYALAKRALGE